MKHAGKRALVTGGSQGMGRAVAERLGAEGAEVIVLASADPAKARLVADGIRAAGGRASAEAADVADAAAVAALAARLDAVPDVIVNCAGLFLPTPVGATAARDVARLVDVNLKGTFHVIDAFVPAMKAARRGWIVNVASVAGLMGIGGYALYCATKAGIIGLTRALACELAPHGIHVNAVAPGNTATPMNEAVRTDAALAPFLAAMAARTPSGRTFSDPAEIAAMVSFLVGDGARPMHGSTVLMDEGFSAGL